MSNPLSEANRAAAVQESATPYRLLLLDVRALRLGLLLAAGAWCAWSLRDLVAPFVASSILTWIGAPVVAHAQRRHIPRYAGSLGFLLLLGALFTALTLLVVPHLVTQLGDLFRRAPRLLTRAHDLMADRLSGPLQAQVDAAVNNLQDQVFEGAQRLATGAARGFGHVLSATALFVLVPLLTFFFLAELPRITAFVRKVLPTAYQHVWRQYGERMQSTLGQMFRGQLTVAVILSFFYVVGLSIAQIPLPIAIGVIAGFAYFIPFATTPICVGLSVLFVLLEPRGPYLLPIVGAVIVAILAQVLESWVLTPRIVGAKARLSPVVVVLSAMIGGELWGFGGVILSLPIATALGVWFRERSRQEATRMGHLRDGHPEDPAQDGAA